MQLSTICRGKGNLAVLGVGLEKLHRASDHYFFGRSRDENALALYERGLLAAIHLQRANALHGDEDHETVELGIVDEHGLVDVIDRGGEMLAADQFHALVLGRLVVGAVVGQHVVVDTFGSLGGVELAIVAVFVLALEVVNAVSDVAGLLDLGQEAARADAVDAARGEEEDVAVLDRIFSQVSSSTICLYSAGVICCFRPLRREAVGSLFITYHISVLPRGSPFC